MMTALAAAKAYAATQNTPAIKPPSPSQEDGGLDFGSMVKSAMNDVMHSTKKAETQIAAQVQGKAELIDVVTAISAAEASLETVMAVRDQVISAYQEIMRMPI
ncbi:flagellar hook-basal body complex protein FliE [Phenylobacterium sp. Root700]|uniref:flagellar hook-basal body complex protein FliE n=1 Tax=Phenylobacterium sp. Root700 TaxID=1736591 RepID=UPI0006F40151|nr:flagellar hook-basal body complex protein FliE [Phenylobacterium sp. Root700]KRB46617.1 flagellar hook-basal body protein FliE [Phenylobacterium sp. Root700]